MIGRNGPLWAVLIALLLLPAPAAADRSLDGVDSWAPALGSGMLEGDYRTRFAPFDLIVVDGEEATRAQVAALRRDGKIVLGYLSIGTIESYRSWYRAARRYRLDLWGDWGEWYADVRAPGFRRLIVRKVAPRIRRKGFDGLFLDNVDMVESHPRRKRGMRLLVRSLARSRDDVLMAQNGEDSIGPVLRYLDAWNREDVTSTYDFDRRRYVRVPAADTRSAQNALRRIKSRGLLVTSIDYTDDGNVEREAVANSCAAGAVPFVSNIELTRIPTTPFRCTVTQG